MPTYAYSCGNHEWTVIKSVSMLDLEEPCPECQAIGTRQIRAAYISPTAGDWNRGEWNPALGCYTKGVGHARQIAKSRGMEEVGTEDPNKIHKHFEKQREEKAKARWADDRELVYE